MSTKLPKKAAKAVKRNVDRLTVALVLVDKQGHTHYFPHLNQSIEIVRDQFPHFDVKYYITHIRSK